MHEVQHATIAEAVLVHVPTEKNTEPLIVRSLYSTPSATSEHQMEEILKTLDSVKTNGTVWICGDLTLPDIIWKDQRVMGNGYPQNISSSFLNEVDDLRLHQTNEQPTRGDAILDIFLPDLPSLFTKTIITRGL